MKRFKVGFAALLVITLVLGLFYRSHSQVKVIEKTEFLFDTYCTVTVYSKNSEDVIDTVFDELLKIHKMTDYFDVNSEVSKINNAGGGQAVGVSDEILTMLRVADAVKSKSDGAFDICIAPLSRLWKFDEPNAELPDAKDIENALKDVEQSGIILDLENKTVIKKTDNTQIDLGGAAKGYAGDAAARILKRYNVQSAIIDLGGNIVCVGKNPTAEDGKWRIGLQKPFAATGEYDKVIEVGSEAVVTSGIYQRYFEKDGRIYHHIIDPKTGYPKNWEFKGVSVVAEDSLTADCIATAAYVLGKEKGTELAEEYCAKIYFLD